MNEAIISSAVINETFSLEVINLRFVDSFSNLSKFSFGKIAKSLSLAYQIIRQIIKQKPELVYFTLVPTGFAFYRDALYITILKLFNLKTLIHLHGKGVRTNAAKSKLRKKLYQFVFNNSEVVCLSEILVDDIRGVYYKQPFIVPNGIRNFSDSTFPTPVNNKSSKEKVTILYLSNFVKSKGLLILIEALGMLKKQGYEFNARFAGEPFDLTHSIIEEQLIKYKLSPDVTLVGAVSGKQKIEEYGHAGIFVFPTCFDAFPLVILEAMQSGLPVVTTFEGAIPEMVIENETGFLVEKHNPEMLADRIATLIDNPALRMEMGIKARQRFLENYTLKEFEKNICDVFQQALDGSKVRKPQRMAVNQTQ